MAKVIWTTPALDDLQDIISFISKDSKVYAERFGARIIRTPRRLVQFPLSGRVVPEFKNDAIRELIYGAYRIIYTIEDDTCYIVAVIHGSRDVLRHLAPGAWEIQ